MKRKLLATSRGLPVAPHAGAWIETARDWKDTPGMSSLPTRERGLKHRRLRSLDQDHGCSPGTVLPNSQREARPACWTAACFMAHSFCSDPRRHPTLRYMPRTGVLTAFSAWIDRIPKSSTAIRNRACRKLLDAGFGSVTCYFFDKGIRCGTGWSQQGSTAVPIHECVTRQGTSQRGHAASPQKAGRQHRLATASPARQARFSSRHSQSN